MPLPPPPPPVQQSWPLSERGSDSSDNLPASAVLLAGALQIEVNEGRKHEVVDALLSRIQHLAATSDKESEKLVTAGIVSTLIVLLKARAVDGFGLEPVLMVLGTLMYGRSFDILFFQRSDLYLFAMPLDMILSWQT
jgi:hypothetical protein